MNFHLPHSQLSEGQWAVSDMAGWSDQSEGAMAHSDQSEASSV